MTRKDTKVKTFDILRFIADNAGLSIFEAIEKAYNMGVSDQEPIVDKIRAEVSKQSIADFIAVQNVLEIIDKYKEEG